ncbi:MAG: dihydrofolate reductase [Candidatus Thermoplasmatota archaeon]
MRVVIIVAAAENGVIGRDGKMPWHLSEDLKRFKRLTMGHPIVMGRKTWDSIGRVLPGRENIIITRQAGFAAPGATVVGSIAEAIDHARKAGASDVFIIGGAQTYAQALPLADVVELTRVHASPEGDARFPALGPEWREVAREEHEGYAFVTLKRKQ